MSALKAGAAYFAAVFAAGFALGVVRSLLLEPIFGELAAVLVELPVILAASWFLCGRMIDRFSVPGDVAARFFMGLIAFALLIAAELMLARYGFNRTLSEQFREWTGAPGAVGLAGQIVFALFPLMQIHARR